MRVILSALKMGKADNLSVPAAADRLVSSYREQKKRLPGFGHRIHTHDPRTARLSELATVAGVSGEAVMMVEALADAIGRQMRPLPINVDGMIAAILLDMGIPPELGNTFFMMARVPGLVAQVHEEMTRERPMRRIHPTDHDYDGPMGNDS